MNSAAKAISPAMGSGYGGSDSKALLASNHASAERARWLNHQAMWILGRFTAIKCGSLTMFVDGELTVAEVFLDGSHADWNNSDIDTNAFRTAARRKAAYEASK